MMWFHPRVPHREVLAAFAAVARRVVAAGSGFG